MTVEYLSKALKSILADPTSELLLVRCDNLPVLRFTATVRVGSGLKAVGEGAGGGGGGVTCFRARLTR